MLLSIIIVNWNSARFLRECLESVRAVRDALSIETIVVDNASFDGCAELLRDVFPEVTFIQSDRNLGFALANNLGISRSRGQYVLFLNPDTKLLDGSLQAMVTALAREAEMGIVGPRLLNSDGTPQLDSVKAFPSLLNQLFDSHYLKTRWPRLSMWGMGALFERESREPIGVDVVSGACLMISRPALERVGGFSDRYYMYSEDVDLCYRVQQAGWTVGFIGTAAVIHHGGRSAALRPSSQFATVLIRESRFLFLRAARGRLYALAYRMVTAMSAVVRLGALTAVLPFLLLRHGLAALQTVQKWMAVLRWSVGLEQWVKSRG